MVHHRYHIIWRSHDHCQPIVLRAPAIAVCQLDFVAKHWQSVHTVVAADSSPLRMLSSSLPSPTNCIRTTKRLMILHTLFYSLNYLSLTMIWVVLLVLHGFPMAQSHHWDHCWRQRRIIFYLDFVVPSEADMRVAFLFSFSKNQWTRELTSKSMAEKWNSVERGWDIYRFHYVDLNIFLQWVLHMVEYRLAMDRM